MTLIFKKYRIDCELTLAGALALVSASMFAAPLAQAISPKTPASRQMRILLKGMVCAYCAHGLSRTLESRPELQSVEVRLGSRDAILTLKPDRSIPEAQLKSAVADAGLQLERIEYAPIVREGTPQS